MFILCYQRSFFYIAKMLAMLVVLSILASSASLYITATANSLDRAIDVYFYIVVVETDSDWTSVEVFGGPIVVGYNYTLIQGSEASGLRYVVEPTRIWIGKQAYDMTPVSVNVSIVAIKGGEQGLITIRKGDIGSTNVSMYAWTSRGFTPIWSVRNSGTNPQYPGTNDRSFTLDFKQLYMHPTSIGVYEDVDLELNEKVLAFYYPWYGVAYGASGQWFHWENASWSSIANIAHYPLPSPRRLR